MEIRRTSRSGLFLLELMIVILFFAITSSICMNLFVSAHLVSEKSSNLTAATREVQTAAESLKAAGDLQTLGEMLGAKPQGGRLDLYFDKDWQKTGRDDARYTVTVLVAGEEKNELVLPDGAVVTPQETNLSSCLSAVVVAWGEKGEIFSVPVGRYLGE